MYCTRSIAENIYWVGGSDRRISLFENLFPTPDGMAYHSYLIDDEKTALLDTVDSSIARRLSENVAHLLGGRRLDYLVINHVEPDHCANVAWLLHLYPEMKIVGNAKTHKLLSQFFEDDMADRAVVVKEGDTLPLGRRTLRFLTAPMVHWPEVMMTLVEGEGILFSADAFGSFGAPDGRLFDDEIGLSQRWVDECRRYYANIVGKFGPQVLAAMKKLQAFDLRMICPLHGFIWRSHIADVLALYEKWATYTPEVKGVAVLMASMYGDTENAVDILAARLAEKGVHDIRVYDVSSTNVSYMIAEIFRCSHVVLASPTYNNALYPAMHNVLHDAQALNLQNRTIGMIQNGSWAPQAGKQMQALLEGMKGMTVLEPQVTLLSSLKAPQLAELDALAEAIAADMAR